MPFEHQGALHLKGRVEVLSNDSLSSLLNTIMPLLTVGGNIPVVLVTPFKKWIADRCCQDTTHCTNTATPQWEADLEMRLADAARHIRTTLFSKGVRHVRVLNPCTIGKGLPQYEVWDIDNDFMPAYRLFDEVASSILTHNKPPPGNTTTPAQKRPHEDEVKKLAVPPLMDQPPNRGGVGRGYTRGRGLAGRGRRPMRGGRGQW